MIFGDVVNTLRDFAVAGVPLALDAPEPDQAAIDSSLRHGLLIRTQHKGICNGSASILA
jgi:hypothetical protein